jgi:hypothetical protein
MFDHSNSKAEAKSVNELLIESLNAINMILIRGDKVLDQNTQLIGQNSQLISDKIKEVERLDRANNWAYGQIDKLTSKLGVSKDAQQ